MMTQKNFEALAAALYDVQAREIVVDAIAAVCAAANPKFKLARFRSLAIIDANSPGAKRREELRELADQHFSESEGLEIDGDAAISEGDDNGAYVAAWLRGCGSTSTARSFAKARTGRMTPVPTAARRLTRP